MLYSSITVGDFWYDICLFSCDEYCVGAFFMSGAYDDDINGDTEPVGAEAYKSYAGSASPAIPAVIAFNHAQSRDNIGRAPPDCDDATCFRLFLLPRRSLASWYPVKRHMAARTTLCP